MSVEFRGYSLKTPEQLHNQVQAAQYTGDIQLVPPTIQDDEVAYQSLLNTPKDELAERYALRMSVYSDLLHRQHSGEEMTEEMQRQFRRISALNNMDTYIAHHHDEETATTLRGRQATVFEDIRNHLEKGKTKGYVTLPTGSGKTVLFTEVVEAMGLRTLIVVPTLPILDQTKAKFEQFAQGVEVGKVYGKEKDANKQVTVITHDSLRIQTDNGTINPQEYDVIIVDEAHENLSPQRRKLLAEFDHAVQLGFTATPEYQEGKPEKHIKSVFEEEIHSMSIREAIKEDMLCGFTIMNVRTHVDISDVQIKNGNYSPEQIEKAVNIHRRNIAPLTIYQEAFNGQSAIAFCASITHAEDVAQLFTEAGIPAAAIHSQLDRNARRDLLAKYESGEIKVLMGVDILTRGFDAPNAQVCFNLVPTLSKVVALQRAGRVLRIDENNPDKVATIVEFDDDDSRGLQFGNLIEPGESHAELLSDNLTEGQRQYIESTRRHLETIDIEGMEVHYELEEVLEILASKLKDDENIEIPEGHIFFDITLLESQLNVSRYKLKQRIVEMSQKQGHLCKISNNGYIHPEILEQVINMFYLPEDCMVLKIRQLARSCEMSDPSMRKQITILSQSNNYPFNLTGPRPYIHNEVYRLLVEQHAQRTLPEGYEMLQLRSLMRDLRAGPEPILEAAERLSTSMGYEFRRDLKPYYIHYKVLFALIDEFALPADCVALSVRDFVIQMHTSEPYVYSRIVSLSTEMGHPYRITGKRQFMHKDVQAVIVSELSPPDGYVSIKLTELMSTFGISYKRIKPLIIELSTKLGYGYRIDGKRQYIHPEVLMMLQESASGSTIPTPE